MQFTVPKLRIGHVIQAKLVETNNDGSFIVDFNGDLLRVVNQSESNIEAGEIVELVVFSVRPLKFQLLSSKKMQARTGLDRMV